MGVGHIMEKKEFNIRKIHQRTKNQGKAAMNLLEKFKQIIDGTIIMKTKKGVVKRAIRRINK